jgi:hypothetical protein
MLLIGIAVVAAGLYVSVVRPTTLARRFASAADRGDFVALNALLQEKHWKIQRLDGKLSDRVGTIDHVYVEVIPWEWADLWHLRRRLIFRTARHTDDGSRYVDWTEDDEVVAGVFGFSLSAPDRRW